MAIRVGGVKCQRNSKEESPRFEAEGKDLYVLCSSLIVGHRGSRGNVT
jgi:hypothetical protein